MQKGLHEDLAAVVVGLAAVTPASGFVTPMAALVIGGVAAPLGYYGIRFREKRQAVFFWYHQ